MVISNCLASSELTKLKCVKGIVQMPLKYLQAWSIGHLSRKPVAVPDLPFDKETLSNVQTNSPLVHIESFSCGLSLDLKEKRSASLFPISLLRKL